MLSRIAESLFWIGRYVERAENTAGILDVQMQRSWRTRASTRRPPAATCSRSSGSEFDETSPVDTAEVLRVLAYDTTSTASIAATLAAARESARRARETLSTSMWEAMNTTYRAIPSGHFRSMRPPVAFRWVRDRAAQINGIAEATMTRDEGYQFLVLGRSIERADMTSRSSPPRRITSGSAWGTSLRACGAYEAFLRTYKGLETERGAAEFLLLDRLFPDRWCSGSARRSAAWSACSPRDTGRGPERGPATPRSDPRRARVPLPQRLRRRPAQRDGAPPAHLRAGDRRDQPALLRRRRGNRMARGPSMSMQLRIAHTTGFEYDGKANTSFNEARLTPLTLPGQIVVHSRVEVSPTPWAYTYRDYWGSQVTAFEVLDPHTSLTATSSATVHTDRSPRRRPGDEAGDEILGDEAVADLHTEYLSLPERVVPTEDLVEAAQEIARTTASPSEAAREVCRPGPRRGQVRRGLHHVEAAGAPWADRAGVCQDMAHMVIGALRMLGIPAR